MNTTGWPELWHVVTAILSRQTPFVQILFVTLAALFVVMALEGFRSSLLAIWRGHRPSAPPPNLDAPIALASPATRSFTARPVNVRRPKPSAAAPRQFRSPRPTIRRVVSPAPAGEDGPHEVPSDEGDTAVLNLTAESAL